MLEAAGFWFIYCMEAKENMQQRDKDEVLCTALGRRLKQICRAYGVSATIHIAFDDDSDARRSQVTFARLPAEGPDCLAMIKMPSSYRKLPHSALLYRAYKDFTSEHIDAYMYPVTRATHPQLVEGFEQLCLMNGFSPIPRLSGTHSPFLSANGAYTIGPEIIRYPVEEVLAILAHEMGHSLEDKHDYRQNENAADRVSARMMHDAEPLIRGLGRYHAMRRNSIKRALTSKNTDICAGGILRQQYVTLTGHTHYGTEEQRFKRLRDVDVEFREPLDMLIERHNERMRPRGIPLVVKPYVEKITEVPAVSDKKAR